MKLQSISIKNFRMLNDVELSLESDVTVIVGRNNSGKTSLTELFHRLLTSGTPKFYLTDFSLSLHKNFRKAYDKYKSKAPINEIAELLPAISAILTFQYDISEAEIGPLSDIIIDLDTDSTIASVLYKFQIPQGQIEGFLKELNEGDIETETKFMRLVKGLIPIYYQSSLFAVDPQNDSNSKPIGFTTLQNIVLGNFINAQRGLDDNTVSERNVLGKILERLFEMAQSDLASGMQQDTSKALEKAVAAIQTQIDTEFSKEVQKLIPTFDLFGYPGLRDPQLQTETTLDVGRLLNNNTKVLYGNSYGSALPENHSGLGSRNLIYILLQLLEFFRHYHAKQVEPASHLLFIEEPEAHLHPQMQEVFIRQLKKIANVFATIYNKSKPWPVQFVISTHSTHIANEAPFEAIRYFMAKQTHDHVTVVKNLGLGFEGNSSPEDKEFLRKYFTLTKCDLFFADKAILIEGMVERILMPKFIKKTDSVLDNSKPQTPHARSLASQYISIIEVGGAFASHFFKLVNFLELKTLIITDIDSVEKPGGGKCPVMKGKSTSNITIKKWFGVDDISPSVLLEKVNTEKENGYLSIAYQIPENHLLVCGRSFEEAFILANPPKFELDEKDPLLSDKAWDLALKVHKTEFALKYGIYDDDWVTPLYIIEGLKWLRSYDVRLD